MRKFYTILIFFLFTVLSQAQIVTIPDANFKAKLLNYYPVIDTNNDGEIQVSEAQTVITLDLVIGYSINDITGLEAFINLENLYLNSTNLLTIDVSMLTNLKIFSCSSLYSITNINVTNLSNLHTLIVISLNLTVES